MNALTMDKKESLLSSRRVNLSSYVLENDTIILEKLWLITWLYVVRIFIKLAKYDWL